MVILSAFVFFLPKIISIKILLSVGGIVWWLSTYLTMCKALGSSSSSAVTKYLYRYLLILAICAPVCFALLVCICLPDRDWKDLTQMACPRAVSHFSEMRKLVMQQKNGSNCLWEGKRGFCVEFFRVCVF